MSQDDARATVLDCHAPDAASVFLAGTFNAWRPDATPMTKDDDGTWSVTLELPPGRHEFKFLVDGQWCCDPSCQTSAECPKCVQNCFGTMNRFVDVA